MIYKNITSDFSVIILAAGLSSRMGTPKLGLKFSEKKTFIEHIITFFLQMNAQEVVLVVNSDGKEFMESQNIILSSSTKIIVNPHPEWERFYSVKLGLQAMNTPQNTCVVNVDNPFLNSFVIKELVAELANADYVYPLYLQQGGHPIILGEKVVRNIIQQSENKLHFKEFLKKYTKKAIPVKDEKILLNINTIEEYRKWFS